MRRRSSFVAALAALVTFGAAGAEAQSAPDAEGRPAPTPAPPPELQVAPTGFVVHHRAEVDAPPEDVWDALVDEVGSWWASSHSFSGDAKNLSIDARRGGCFCERLTDGGWVEHLRVIHAAPGATLRLSGALGPLQASGLAGSLTWSLSDVDGRTAVELTYSVGGFIEGGFERIAPAVQGVLGEQLARLERFVETGEAEPAGDGGG